jgi:hypothetical protein
LNKQTWADTNMEMIVAVEEPAHADVLAAVATTSLAEEE